jgi:hypothetical protein
MGLMKGIHGGELLGQMINNGFTPKLQPKYSTLELWSALMIVSMNKTSR